MAVASFNDHLFTILKDDDKNVPMRLRIDHDGWLILGNLEGTGSVVLSERQQRALVAHLSLFWRGPPQETHSYGPLAYKISDLPFGRTHAYEEIAAGRLQAVKCGAHNLIMADELKRYLASLPKRQPQAKPQ